MTTNPVAQGEEGANEVQDLSAVGHRLPGAARAWWGLLGLICLVALAYAQTLSFDLVMEDHFLVVDNRLLRSWSEWWGIFTSPPSAYLGSMSGADRMYRPLMVLTGAADRLLWGMRPWGFHLSSVLGHLVVVVLLWRLAWQITWSTWAAFATGALLAVHPSAVEAVTMVAARMDLFVGMGMVATLLMLRGCIGPGGTRRLVAALLCFAFALCSKETALAIPPVVTWAAWVYPRWFTGPGAAPRRSALAARVMPFWILLALYAVVRKTVMWSFAPMPLHLTDIPTQLLRALVALGTYLDMALIPRPSTGFIIANRLAPPAGVLDGRVLVGLVAVFLLLTALLWLRRRNPAAALALGGFAAAIVPTSNILPIHWAQGVYVAERSLYPALLFWCLFLVVAIHPLFLREEERGGWAQPFVRSLGVAVLGTLLIVTGVKAAAWRNNLTLWTAAYTADPDSVANIINLAGALARAGDLRRADDIAQGAAVRSPRDPNLAYLAGWLAEQKGESSEALQRYERALALGADLWPGFRDTVVLAARLREWDMAGRWFGLAADRFPKAAWPQVGLGWYHERQGRSDLARAHFERAARLEPSSPEPPWLLSQLLAAEGRRREAVQAARAALALDSSFIPARRALALVAEQEGQTGEAIVHWRHIADSLPAGQQGEALEHLRRLEAAAGARRGRP